MPSPDRKIFSHSQSVSVNPIEEALRELHDQKNELLLRYQEINSSTLILKKHLERGTSPVLAISSVKPPTDFSGTETSTSQNNLSRSIQNQSRALNSPPIKSMQAITNKYGKSRIVDAHLQHMYNESDTDPNDQLPMYIRHQLPSQQNTGQPGRHDMFEVQLNETNSQLLSPQNMLQKQLEIMKELEDMRLKSGNNAVSSDKLSYSQTINLNNLKSGDLKVKAHSDFDNLQEIHDRSF